MSRFRFNYQTFFYLLPSEITRDIDVFSGGLGGTYSMKSYILPKNIPAYYGSLLVLPSGHVFLSSLNCLLVYKFEDDCLVDQWNFRASSTILGVYQCEKSLIHVGLCGNEQVFDQNGNDAGWCFAWKRTPGDYDCAGNSLTLQPKLLTVGGYWTYPLPFHARASCFLNQNIYIAAGNDHDITHIVKLTR
jgi:hypothetical protein